MTVKASDFRLEEPNTWCTMGRALEILEEGDYKGDIYIGTESGEGFQYIGSPDKEQIVDCFNDIWRKKRDSLENKYYSLLKHKIGQIGNISVLPAIDGKSDDFLELVHFANDLKKLSSMTYNLVHYFEKYVDILERHIVKPVHKRIQDDCPIFIVSGLERDGKWYKNEPPKYFR